MKSKQRRSGAGDAVRISSATANQPLRFESRYFGLLIDACGRQIELIDKAKGTNYLRGPAPFWQATIGQKNFGPSQIKLQGQNLTVSFGNEAEAVFRIVNKSLYLTLEVVSVSPGVEQLTLADFNLTKMETIARTMNAAYNSSFAFSVMALTMPVHCRPEGSNLQATCYAKYGIKGNKIALLGCPLPKLTDIIQNIEKAEGLPFITLSGKWGKLSPDVKRSYLFLSDLSEQNCDRAIAYAKKLNSGMIMLHETWASQTMGHFPINRELFPHGRAGLKAVVAKLHRAGIKVGLHLLTTGVSFCDKYLTPVPDPRLYRDAFTKLTGDIDAVQDAIPCASYDPGFPECEHPGGHYRGSGVVIQIDQEVISYGACSKTPPYRFTQCRRGAFGTRATAHRKGATVAHLRRSFSFFMTDLDTTIEGEIGARIAAIVDDCRCDMLYFDGAEQLQGDHWYYNPKLVSAFYQKISPARRNHILYQASSLSHYGWHQLSRYACADGYKDIKANVNHASEKYPARFDDFMPLDIGWYGIGQKGSSYSDIEYVMSRSAGWNSSVGLVTSIAKLDYNPETPTMVEMAGTYDRLRLRGYFTESTKAALRLPVPRHLVKLANNRWKFFDQEQKTIRTVDGADNVWQMPGTQPHKIAELQIVVGGVTAPGPVYQGATSIPVVDFKSAAIIPFDIKQTPEASPGVIAGTSLSQTAGLGRYALKTCPVGNPCGEFRVKSRAKDKSGAAVFIHKCARPLNLAAMKGLGFWIWGDGKGAMLSIRLCNPSAAYLDFTLALDFKGWQYREIANFRQLVGLLENRGKLDKSNVSQVDFVLTGLPPQDETTFRLAGLMALPEMSASRCANPSLTIGTRTITFPVSLSTGESLTCISSRAGVVTDRQGRHRTIRPIGNLPVLKKGRPRICFSADQPMTNEVTVRISV